MSNTNDWLNGTTPIIIEAATGSTDNLPPTTPTTGDGSTTLGGNSLQLPSRRSYEEESSTSSVTPLNKHLHQDDEEYNIETTNIPAPPVHNQSQPIRRTTTGGSPFPALHKLTTILTSSSVKYPPWLTSPEEMSNLHDPKSLRALYELGGYDRLCEMLKTSELGLDENNESDLGARRHYFGINKLPERSTRGFLRLCYEAMKDKVLIILSIAALVSLALGLYETFGAEPEYDDEGNQLPRVDWVEGVAILVAVCIVVLVGAINDYQKERQFAKLNAKKEDRELIVIRNGGEQKMISIYDLLVGDIINLQTGDVVPADAVLFDGDVECDESSITGESNTIIKIPVKQAMNIYESKLPTDEDIGSHKIKFRDPFLISGSKILSGLGNAVVTAVGENSIHGRTMMSLSHEPETTPMQVRLDNLAEGISKYGFLAAFVLFVVLFIRFCIEIAPGGTHHELQSSEKGKMFIDIIITAVTIVVVAIPEGLPLAVTLALAFATTRMVQNGNLVRVLKSCETMGGATAICCDKTGTLTENKMKVVTGVFGLDYNNQLLEYQVDSESNSLTNISHDLKDSLGKNITLNSTAFENVEYDEEKARLAHERPHSNSIVSKLFSKNKQPKHYMEMGIIDSPYLGNKTESALLLFAKEEFHMFDETTLDAIRHESHSEIVQLIPFESSRKWSGIVVKINQGFRIYIKGAAEIVFNNCGHLINSNCDLISMDPNTRERISGKIDEYANDALRTIALAHFDFIGEQSWPPSHLALESNPQEADANLLVDIGNNKTDNRKDYVLDALVGIQDPLKKGVPQAVLQCKRAGVVVRMVTGDNINTAKAISKSCHILTPEDLENEYAFMEGPNFRKLSLSERNRIVPQLRVLARSSPEDKRILVDTLRKSGEVVAVTGDGTNDAPALKLADVGFSMGIAGTEVAREASDIILMTDDFTDIVQAIKWGRTVAISIKKFIQFQLTVNVTACVLTFVSAVASSENQSVLTAVQLLWVNLIMDTLAALALATDKPDDSFLNRRPAGRTAPLISTSMWKMILGQSTMQLVITFVLHFAGQKLFFGNDDITDHQSQQLSAMTFNTFVWLQIWKLFVTRKLDEADEIETVRGRITLENLNFFSHLFRNWYFIFIAVLISACQILIMFVGGASFSIAKQTPGMWATAIICGFFSIPMGLIIRIIPNVWVERVFPTRAFKKFVYIVSFAWLRKKKKTSQVELEEGDETL
ncbi:Calcium-transporting ATPase 2 [Spathaspora sp. JA1]|nr:Calcium-transporting ATPase 2 [Spathaspora sp. JA1]